MRRLLVALAAAGPMTASAANAQFFNRSQCDPSVLEVRSQMSVNVPIASTDTGVNAAKDARRQLYTLAEHECDTFHQIFGGDCVVTSVNMNSSIQDRGAGSRIAFVSTSNVYTVKRSAK